VIARRMCHARNEALTDRIADDGEDDWDGVGRPFQRCDDWRAVGDDQVRSRVHQLRRISLDTIVIAAGKTIVDPNVTAFDPPECLEPVPKGHDAGL